MEKPFIIFTRGLYSQAVQPYFVGQIEKETAKQVKLASGPARQIPPGDIIKRFTTYDEAIAIVQEIDGKRRQYQRTEREAAATANAAIAAILAKA